MLRWLGAVVVLVLAVAWFFLDSLETRSPPLLRTEVTQADASRAGLVVASPFEEAGEESTGAVPSAAGGQAAVDEPVKLGAPSRLKDAFDRADSLLAAGDVDAAAALLRQMLAEQTDANEAARIGLRLAPLVSDLAERRGLLSSALWHGVVLGQEYDAVGEQLRRLNADPASSLLPLLTVESYVVEPGDSLWRLCNSVFPERFGSAPEVGLVMLVNGLESNSLRVGQRLVVPAENLSIRVDNGQHGLVAFLGRVALAAYRVGLGKQDRTPRGQFSIEVKQENPAWFTNGRVIPFGEPENVLGTRWMGFEDRPGAIGYGIHGTDEPESVGLNRSMGCVRMRNEEVEELFEWVPRGTAVLIQ